jgi:hypothetical protein
MTLDNMSTHLADKAEREQGITAPVYVSGMTPQVFSGYAAHPTAQHMRAPYEIVPDALQCHRDV